MTADSNRMKRLKHRHFTLRVTLGRRILLGAAVVITLAAPFGIGLLHALQINAQLLHTSGATRPAFEVATIKPSKNEGQHLSFFLSPNGFQATHASLWDLVRFAYLIKTKDQLVGMPSWTNSAYFDIQAKESDADIQTAKQHPMPDQMNVFRLRVQSLLAERFQLKSHIETRQLPMYALVIAPGGIKMKADEPGPPPPPGTPFNPNGHYPGLQQTGPNQTTATEWPIKETTDWLSRFEELDDRPVVDETGLTGHYDWVLNDVSQRLLPPDPTGSSGQEPTESIFKALPEQLGLKLVPRNGPVEVLVIDQADPPSPN